MTVPCVKNTCRKFLPVEAFFWHLFLLIHEFKKKKLNCFGEKCGMDEDG